MKQNKLNEKLQTLVLEQARVMYPEAVESIEVPLMVCLPMGIHPYNRNTAYYDPVGNAIVLYQDLGRQALAGDLETITGTVQHELAHWYQFQVLGETGKGKANLHRRKTWMQACYMATCNLFPALGLTREQFTTYTSKRVEGKVVKVPREGSLTDTQLHHWPRSLEEFSAA